jgi:sigma-E factor negative regulatory protein RseA
MHEHINEKISQFLDNELDANDAFKLMRQVMLDTELKNTLLRYEAIGHALKTESFIAPQVNFLDRIHQELEHEPVYLLPQQRKPIVFKPQHKILALVASAALVAVILPKDATRIQGAQMKASSGITLAQQHTQKRSENIIKQLPRYEQLPLNAQINEYLQAHNKNVDNSGNAPVAPIAEITAYDQK